MRIAAEMMPSYAKRWNVIHSGEGGCGLKGLRGGTMAAAGGCWNPGQTAGLKLDLGSGYFVSALWTTEVACRTVRNNSRNGSQVKPIMVKTACIERTRGTAEKAEIPKRRVGTGLGETLGLTIVRATGVEMLPGPRKIDVARGRRRR